MPIDPDTDQLIPFDDDEIEAMEIETLGVRDGSHPTETREIGTNTMRREFLVKWSERYNFLTFVLGDVKTYDDSGTTKLSRLLPDELYGRHPEKPQFVATKIEEMTGHQIIGEDENGMPEYTKARVKVFYEHVPYVLKDDDEVSNEFGRYIILPGMESSPSQADAISMPGSAFHYIREADSGNNTGTTPHMVPIPFNIFYVTMTQERKFTWVRLPEDAWGPGTPLHQRVFEGEDDGDLLHPNEYPYIGTINQQDFDLSYLGGYPAGTLLFDHVDERKYRSPLGEGYNWDLTFVFKYKPTGWNWFRFFDTSGALYNDNGIYPVSADNGFYTADILPDDRSVYNARDFDRLFQVG